MKVKKMILTMFTLGSIALAIPSSVYALNNEQLKPVELASVSEIVSNNGLFTFDKELKVPQAKDFKKDESGNVILENGLKLEKNLLTDNYTKGVKITPEYIVIHDTANEAVGANVDMHRRYWSRPVGTSAHYIVDDSKAMQLLENDWFGWHTGVLFTDHPKMPQVKNSNSIGIEIAVNKDGDFDKSFQNAISLTKYLMKELNIDADHVVTHDDATGKGCPHKMLQEHPEYWKLFKHEIRSEDNTKAEWLEDNAN